MSNEREIRELCTSFNKFIIRGTHAQKVCIIIEEQNKVSTISYIKKRVHPKNKDT